ncbi:hypothetical protein TCAL_06691 [Tigriopus californicus]|uniref:Uncharacterized protein n=1 Tax=Tigriopus californicus TaxID=6832 RepID=A0A553P7W7_TIGCA|nr:uncharacterized protein LOC131877970 [Tigriopus californicus]XP_059079812.1 uncharacterized protein LOC131877970 [Tigriopus californicus]TRY73730.1 hypothetical protein TCAL_06691 [Tigriopus californicus]|eukprot:TCALIF_06691-PA protein Name:"Protein of unknown function" AED:0.08 eAED:0.08 QI:309/1/1/1/0.66/0.5/4/130/249
MSASTKEGSVDHHHDHHGNHHDEEHMADMVKNIPTNTSISTISQLIDSLRARLTTLRDKHSIDLDDRHGKSSNLHELGGHNPHDHEDHEPAYEASGVGDLIHGDTMILLGSCIFMIILGLILRKVFMYFTHIRGHREQYHGGIRQMGEHMHTVTRTMSTDPNQTFAQDTPAIKKKPIGTPQVSMSLPAITKSNNPKRVSIEETAFDEIMPQSHTMLVDDTDDIHTMTTIRQQLEARRLSKMKNYFETQD